VGVAVAAGVVVQVAELWAPVYPVSAAAVLKTAGSSYPLQSSFLLVEKPF
jgi:hypothetical protein